MKIRLLIMSGLLAGVGVAQAAGAPLFIFPLMKGTVAPQAQVLWDVGNRAYDDDGNINVSKFTADDWAKLAKAAQAMKDISLAMAQAPSIGVAPDGVKIQDEGAPGVASAKQIQAYIDADPKGFAQFSQDLANVSDGFLAAAKGKDGQKLADTSAKLDEVCEACHKKYWYPG